MKICFISPCDLSIENGGRTCTLELVKNWVKLGHRVFLFSRGLQEKDASFHYFNLPFPGDGYISRFLFAITSAIALIIYHIRFRFDVVYQWMSVFDFAILIARSLRIPVVAEFDDIPYSESFSELIPRETRFLRRNLLRLGRIILKPLESLNFRSSTLFIAMTPKIRRIETYPQIQQRVHFLPFGANTELFKPLDKLDCRTTLTLSHDDKLICFIGSFHQWHGLEDVIRGMVTVTAKVPDSKLLIVGGDDYPGQKGSLREKLEKMSDDLGLKEKIIFAGRVPYQRVPLYINASDVCVTALRTIRSGHSPLKLFEYMACGKPVVATDVEGITEFLTESQAGILVPSENLEELARALTKLLKDKNLTEQMGRNGHQYVLKNYSWEHVATMAAKICQQAIAR